MSAKIISSHRYKKTTRKKANVKREQKYKYLNNKKKNNLNYINKKQKNESKIKRLNIEEIKVDNSSEDGTYSADSKHKRSSMYIPKTFKIVALIICIIIIAFLSKNFTNVEDSPIVKVFSNKEDKDKYFEKDYALKVGITNLDTTDVSKSKNIILKELEKLASASLIKVNSDYTIKYLGAKTIDKVSNREYNVLLNDKSKISIDDVKNSINSIKKIGENSIYYKYLSKVESVEEISKKQFKIILSEDNPYFLYALDFPILSSEEKAMYKFNNKTDTSISYIKNNTNSSIGSINMSNYNDSDKMVEDFRNNNIDVFFASTNNAMQLIGKHEYNVKKYRNGETIFILGNKESKIFNKKEIRQSIVYSLNREEIVKEVNNNYGEVIDLPFIYSNIKYKYDIYGAQNVLLSNSWTKDSEGIYCKNDNGQIFRAELNLVVNNEDENKLKIAQKIKEMCYKSGVLINVNAISKMEVEEKIVAKDYDIVLADVLIDDYPDISYLQEYININDEVNNAILQVNNSSLENLPQNIQNLQNVMSDEVVCIGVFARNINVVFQKDISGINSVRYFNIFEDIEKMGKIIDRIGG